MGLSALDVIVILLVVGGAVLGAAKGFVTEVLSLVAWLFVISALRILHAPVAALLAGPLGSAAGAAVLAFVLIAGATYFCGRWIARSIGKRTRSSILGPVDRALGFGFGGFKGLILASLVFLLIVLVIDTAYGGERRRPDWIVKSRTYPLLKATSGGIAEFVDRRRRGAPVFGDNETSDNLSDAP